jgi:hypothetical protein
MKILINIGNPHLDLSDKSSVFHSSRIHRRSDILTLNTKKDGPFCNKAQIISWNEKDQAFQN